MNNNKINAAPTKRFFISVLVKDINLLDAIVELVDNSIDAARSKLSAEDFKKTVVTLNLDSNNFFISDNSGGMSIEHAKNNAFRFGRPDSAPTTPGTVGEFGVGMKRALFKLGRTFHVSSRTHNEYFTIDVDVDEWEKRPEAQPDTWSFEFSSQGQNISPELPNGTEIKVSDLLSHVSQELGNAAFQSRLMETIRQAHAESLANGLQVIVNNIPVQGVHALLLSSEDLKPIVKKIILEIDNKIVNVSIMAGVGEAKLIDAGWYIYCNGRQIERAEKTEKTGWNSTIEDSDRTPKAHWQFRRFRGYVFFQSSSQDVLPWNTTKTSLDVESASYLQIFPEITACLRQILEFLNALDSESSQPGELTALIESAKLMRVSSLTENTTFSYNARPFTPQTKEIRISYVKPAEIVNIVKEHLGAKNNRDLGEKTFDYYIQNEGLDG